MRKLKPRHIAATLLLVVALLPACAARPGTATTGTGITVSDALTQAQGCATALAELTKASPMNAGTKAQVGNWSAWLDFALRAAGVVARATGV